MFRMIAKRFGFGKSQVFDRLGEIEQEIGQGSVGQVVRFRLDRGRNKQPAYFAYKRYHSNYNAEKRAQHGMKVQRRLLAVPGGKDHTVATMRYTNDGLFMSDLSEGGKNIVMSSNDPSDTVLSQARALIQENPRFAEQFVQQFDFLEETWVDRFNLKAAKLAEIAARAGVTVSGDSVVVVIQPNGEYKLAIVDMDNVTLANNPDGLRNANYRVIQSIQPFIGLLALKLSE